ncbi:hypothetical protein [Rubellicoccus peritrichatus]|uniref:Trimeric autotransporter adhesin YadA-like head domain-containing protein n=1 Tax=Rubellicoccus peritrichatus TaxID=3080537 RepID=A0AAQ3QVY0_9BACT|nr:hypothetical protein [Puniceicoccus sp. CR14]WOO42093.1 hypothetical protein RZN69_03265 [Puniceicoccus sp. CR14]
MKTELKKSILTLIGAIVIHSAIDAQTTLSGDHVIDGNLTVNQSTIISQNLDVDGNFEFGLTEVSPGVFSPAISNAYVDGLSTFTLGSVRNDTIIEWRDGHVVGGALGNLRMIIDANNKLVLYNPTSPYGAMITIDPDGTTPSISINGEDVLTTSSGVAPYLSSDIPVAAGTGTNSVVVGSSAANSDHSLAFGQSVSTAPGADHSFIFGQYSGATGYRSFVFGAGITASGNDTFVSGLSINASGDHTSAFGENLQAQGSHQFVIGRNNIAQGDNTQWIDSDDLLIIGNGVDSTNRSNAFVVKKNGDTDISGRLSVGNSSAIGINSAAFGSSTANSDHSLAFGQSVSTAPGADHSFIFGQYSGATGYRSFVFGAGITASGNDTFVSGLSINASGDHTSAFGENLQAQGSHQFVIGLNNIAQGNSTQWIDSDDLLIVGNGIDGTNPSNALAVQKNGQSTLTNRYWDSVNPTTIPADPDLLTPEDESSAGNALVVDGHTLLKGRVVIAEAQGDIPMFTPAP